MGLLGTQALVAAWPFGDPPGRGGWSSDRLMQPLPANPLTAALTRAARAQRQPGALPPAFVAVWLSDRDEDGRAFSGTSRYVLHFSRAALPPDAPRWTIDAVGDKDSPAEDGRSSLAGDAPDLRRNADGSLDILVQVTPPDDPVANWLAVPAGRFRLILRRYAPLPAPGWSPTPALRREGAA